MLKFKVNEEKLLRDQAELVAKRDANLAEIEAQAMKYAIERGYDEEKTSKFVAYTKGLEGDGLSLEEKAKLDFLTSYIDEFEFDEPAQEEVAEKSSVDDLNVRDAFVKII